jgi:hypothetical protein
MAKALSSGAEAMLAHSENRYCHAAASRMMKIMISLKSSKALSINSARTLPLLDLNLTEHAKNPRGWRDLHLGRR